LLEGAAAAAAAAVVVCSAIVYVGYDCLKQSHK
jgi:hypothetical protein